MEFNKSISIFLFLYLILSLSAPSSTSSIISQSTSKSASSSTSPSTSSKLTNISPVDKICNVTKTPNNCIKFLTPLAGSSTDPVSALHLIIDAAFQDVEIGVSVIARAKKDHSIPKEISEPLKICLESYGGIIVNLIKAFVECSVPLDIKAAKGLLNGSIRFINVCEKSFADHPHDKSPIKNIDATLVELLGYGVDIAKSLIK